VSFQSISELVVVNKYTILNIYHLFTCPRCIKNSFLDNRSSHTRNNAVEDNNLLEKTKHLCKWFDIHWQFSNEKFWFFYFCM